MIVCVMIVTPTQIIMIYEVGANDKTNIEGYW